AAPATPSTGSGRGRLLPPRPPQEPRPIMANIDAKIVNDLRLETGAGMMDCKKALEEANGDKGKAKEILKKKGLEKADNIAAKGAGGGGPKEGRIGTYIHSTGKVAAMIELNCDTDFVEKNEEFQALMKDLAVAVCAFEPIAVSKDQVPADVVEAEDDAEDEH